MARKKAQPGKAVIGDGVEYLIATYTAPVDGAGTIFIPAPNPNPLNLRDLQLVNGLPVVIHDSWQNDTNFRRYMESGEVTLSISSSVPSNREPELDPAYDMDDKQKQFAINFVKLWPNDQFKQAAQVAQHINPKTGMPTSRESAVTVTFLKSKHLTTLSAARDLENRWHKRRDVIEFLTREIETIEAL